MTLRRLRIKISAYLPHELCLQDSSRLKQGVLVGSKRIRHCCRQTDSFYLSDYRTYQRPTIYSVVSLNEMHDDTALYIK